MQAYLALYIIDVGQRRLISFQESSIRNTFEDDLYASVLIEITLRGSDGRGIFGVFIDSAHFIFVFALDDPVNCIRSPPLTKISGNTFSV